MATKEGARSRAKTLKGSKIKGVSSKQASGIKGGGVAETMTASAAAGRVVAQDPASVYRAKR